MKELPLSGLERPNPLRLNLRSLKRAQLYNLAAVVVSLATGLVVAYSAVRLFRYELNPSVIFEPYMIRKGFVIYQELGQQKSPLLPLFVAWLLPLFQDDAALAVRVMHAVFTTAIVTGFLFWTYRAAGKWALLASAVFFLAWSNLYGYWALLYYDFVLTPVYFAALLFFSLSPGRQNARSFGLFGLATGVALLVKQHSITLAVPVYALLAWRVFRRQVSQPTALRLALIYLAGLALPVAIFAGWYFLRTGSFAELLYWLVWANLNGNYASMAFKLPQPRELLPLLFSLVLLAPYLFTLIKRVDDQTPPRATRIWLLVLAALALVYIYPRWSTRHLSVAFPFIAAMSGIAFADLVGRQPVRRHARLVGILVAVWWAFHAVGLVTRASMQTAARTYPGYSDVGELAQKLNSRVPSAGTLALLPADEGNLNLYYLMQREPPRYIFYNYPWYLEERLVRRWLASVKNEPPAAVIYFPGRWDIERYAPELLDYTREHYRVTSVFNWQGNRVEVFEPVR